VCLLKPEHAGVHDPVGVEPPLQAPPQIERFLWDVRLGCICPANLKMTRPCFVHDRNQFLTQLISKSATRSVVWRIAKPLRLLRRDFASQIPAQ
jgi:hypothetical protein